MKTTFPNLRKQLRGLDGIRRRTLYAELRWAVKSAHRPPIRPRVQFAKEVIVIPEGRHEGSLWLPEFQPVHLHLLQQMDDLGFRRFAITGCVQSGKTLVAVVVNILWHLFERKQNVLFIVPEKQDGDSKWIDEIKPVIDASRWLRQQAYGSAKRTNIVTGKGSKGGTDHIIRFANGTRLQFMQAGGKESRRTSVTFQVVFKTEVDRYDEAGGTAREASAAETVEDRAESFGDDAYIYEECTMTVEKGRINQQVRAGTDTCCYYPCPHCREYTRPLRKDFIGVAGCESSKQARREASFVCPECRAILSQDDRDAMLDKGVPVSRGQSVRVGTDGAALIEGDLPETETFSFWWNAFDNRFWTTSRLAYKEWRAMYGSNQDDEDKQSRQKRWTLPAVPDEEELDPITPEEVVHRHGGFAKGIVPPNTWKISAGCDVRNTQVHFVVVAWTKEGVGRVFDYGIMPVGKEGSIKQRLIAALEKLRDTQFYRVTRNEAGQIIDRKPAYHDAEGRAYVPAYTIVDGSYKTPVLREFMRRTASAGVKGWMMVFGRGQSEPPQSGRSGYTHPEKLTERVKWIGDDPCYVSFNKKYGLMAMFANSDWWKTFVHEGLKTEGDAPGSLHVFEPEREEDVKLAWEFGKQIAAEGAYSKHVPRRGVVWLWRNDSRRQNHFFDCFYYACAGAHLAGVRWAVELRPDYNPSNQIARNPAPAAADAIAA